MSTQQKLDKHTKPSVLAFSSEPSRSHLSSCLAAHPSWVFLPLSFHPIHKKQFAQQNPSATISAFLPALFLTLSRSRQSNIQPSYCELSDLHDGHWNYLLSHTNEHRLSVCVWRSWHHGRIDVVVNVWHRGSFFFFIYCIIGLDAQKRRRHQLY